MRVTGRGVAAVLGGLVVAGVCVSLGFWQLDRREQRRTINAAVADAIALPPLDLDGQALAAILRDPDRYRYRRVRVTGSYRPGEEIVLRGRAHGGRPGVHLVSPLHPAGDLAVVLVNRGWVPSPDAATVDPRPFREPDPRGALGILHELPAPPPESAPSTVRVGDLDLTTYRRLDRELLQSRFERTLLPLYVQLLPTDDVVPEAPVRVPPPSLDEGPHLGYALQWFSFAAIALLGLLTLLLRSSGRERGLPTGEDREGAKLASGG